MRSKVRYVLFLIMIVLYCKSYSQNVIIGDSLKSNIILNNHEEVNTILEDYWRMIAKEKFKADSCLSNEEYKFVDLGPGCYYPIIYNEVNKTGIFFYSPNQHTGLASIFLYNKEGISIIGIQKDKEETKEICRIFLKENGFDIKLYDYCENKIDIIMYPDPKTNFY